MPSLLLALLLAAPGDPLLQPLAAAPSPLDPAALYAEHCARCHGAEGDGKGWTELDRPARSFRDGGFSYGNTRGALVRSIRYGIPGTPMPAFPDEVLSAAQREALADFVIAFGPPGTVVEPGASVLRVDERPAVVRGILPPLEGDNGRVPRGLLVGFPTGTTFEYRADDVRLRAVRQGEFVDRRDWGDRGGIPLRPLGRVVLDTRASAGAYTTEGGEALTLRLAGTEVDGDRVHVRGRLVDAAGRTMGQVTETLCVAATDAGPVPVRTLALAAAEGSGVRAPALPSGARLEAAFRGADGRTYHVHRVDAGLLRVTPRDAAAATVHEVLAPRWLPALEHAIPSEVTPR